MAHTADATTSEPSSPRAIGPVIYILWLSRVQLLVSIVLIVTLSDLAIAGSMREAMRYSIIDAPYQLAFIALALVLCCASLRFTCEATIELVSPDLFDALGGIGRFAHLVPRALAFLVGVAAGLPILELALDPYAIGGAQNQLIAGAAGLSYVAIAIFMAAIPRGPHAPGFARKMPSFLLRWTIALFPVALATIFCGAVLGVWTTQSGTSYHALERYVSAIAGFWDASSGAVPGVLSTYVHAAPDRYTDYVSGSALIVSQVSLLLVAAELAALFVACVAARWAVAIFLDLIVPNLVDYGALARLFRVWLPRLVPVGIGIALALEMLNEYLRALPPDASPLSGNETVWVWGIAAVYALLGFAASIGRGSDPHTGGIWHESPCIGRKCMGAAQRISALSRFWQWFFALLLIAATVTFFLFVDTHQVARAQTIGPVAIILLWGFTAAALFFPLAYLSHMTHVPILTILLLAAVTYAGFNLNDNHELRGSVPASAAQLGAPDTRDFLALDKWIASRNDWQRYDHYPVFIVATEGGGIRAAYFTASILSALQERCPGFAQHTLAISGVSGGSVGAAVFAALTADSAHNSASAPCALDGRAPGPIVARAGHVLSADLLSPLLGAMLFPDALQRILPVPIMAFDRSRALEYALEQSWTNATANCPGCDPNRLSEKASDLYGTQSAAAAVPYLFLNTTEAGTGRSIPYATVRVADLATTFRNHAQIDLDADSQLESVSLQDNMPVDDVPLSAAAVLSARFPYLTPAGHVADSFHYVDGGYFENSGTWFVSGLVQNLLGQQLTYRNAANPALEKAVHNAVFITIVIESEPCTREIDLAPCDEEGVGSDSTWSEALSPLRALLNTRDKRAVYSITDLSAMTALVEELSGSIDGGAQASLENDPPPKNDDHMCHYRVCAVTLQFRNAAKVEVPLTWVLSSRARAAMDEAVAGMETAPIEKVTQGSGAVPADASGGNRVIGSYDRIICILEAQQGSKPCPAGVNPSPQ